MNDGGGRGGEGRGGVVLVVDSTVAKIQPMHTAQNIDVELQNALPLQSLSVCMSTCS